MSEAPTKKKKKEKTIRSETTRVFLVVFGILVLVGFFNIISNLRGMNTFDTVEQVYLKQYDAAENMGKKASDIIALSYLLAGDHDMNLLLAEMGKYQEMVKAFKDSKKQFRDIVASENDKESGKILAVIDKISKIFVNLNNNASVMTISIMEGNKEKSKKAFSNLNKNIVDFRTNVNFLIVSVGKNLKAATAEARSGLLYTSILGAVVIFLAVFITLGLIYYLMSFLSVSLLPISNLMHNLRQAVFTIDKDHNVIAPVSAYSSTVFGKDIVGQNVVDMVYKDVPKKSEMMSGLNSALSLVFGEDEIQWISLEDCFPAMVDYKEDDSENILKLTYTPLLDKNECVQNIMIVAEDVTEIEKLRSEAKKKEGEVAIIQSLVNMDTQDLEAFLKGANQLLESCFEQFDIIEEDAKPGELLFRNLHTLKGNSRMHALNVLSEVTHEAEGALAEVNNRIRAKEVVESSYLVVLRQQLLMVEACVASHAQIAKRFLGIDNVMQATMWRRFVFNMGMLEYLSATDKWAGERSEEEQERDAQADSRWRLFIGNGETIVKEAQNLSEILGMEVLAKDLARVRFGDEKSIEIVGASCTQFLQDYVNYAPRKRFDEDYDSWVEVFKKLLAVSESLQSDQSWEEKSLGSKQNMISILNIVGAKQLSYLQILVVRALDYLELDDQDSFLKCHQELWAYAVLVIHFDSTYRLGEGGGHQIKPVLAPSYQKPEQAIKAMQTVSRQKCFLLAFLGSMARGNQIPLDVFKTIVATFGDGYIKSADPVTTVIDYLVGNPSADDLQQQVADFIEGTKDENLPGPFDLALCLPGRACLTVELKRHLDTLTEKAGSEEGSDKEQTLEVPLHKIQNIKVLADKLVGPHRDDNNAHKLLRLISSAFDYPLKNLFKNIQSVVSDMAGSLDKKVNLKITGDDVGIEREIAHALRDALVHMARNTMDHGIESPSERKAAGKNEVGTLHLECYEADEDTCKIRISDDGRGIDSDKLVSKALANGVITEGDVEQLDDKGKMALIFLSGLSTKEQVSAFSGRGVGMDAVKSTIEDLGGSIELASVHGKGTVFDIVLPIHTLGKSPSQMAG